MTMKKRCTEAQIAFALRQAASGTALVEIIRRMGCDGADVSLMDESIHPNRSPRDSSVPTVGGGELSVEAPLCGSDLLWGQVPNNLTMLNVFPEY